MSNYEERLLVELRTLVRDEPVVRGRRRRLALAGGLASAVAAAVVVGIVAFSTGAKPAYAVTKHADGTISVEIDSLTDAAGLQAKLQAAGVTAVVEYLPAGKMCRQPWYTPVGAGAPGMHQSTVGRSSDGSTQFTISGDEPAGATLVIQTQTGPDNARALAIGWAQGAVPPCDVIDAPAGSGPLGGPQP